MSTILDPRSIEREIARIRERESNPYSSGVKTNLFTLVIFRKANEPGTGDPISSALQYMLGRRPARIITIGQGDSAETDVIVSGRCFPDRRNRGVCFEEVAIENGADGRGQDPGAWAPLLIRDLPVFAWWPDGLSGSGDSWQAPILAAASLIDKLIVDSGNTPDDSAAAGEALRSMLALREKAGGSFFLSDFAWRRSRVLRELTARAFDQPENRPRLAEIRSVSLDGGTRADGLLFFSWLSVRLGWAPASGDRSFGVLT
ncbi:MAG TPA: glucose-6-phosphate dehydrogenase assembly protein OpcA, partial [Spirochaetia bacterium]|nr:glucose-6-phosphate dehydrogenase assembly protein OpcA [Spirochaetia bacterium]